MRGRWWKPSPKLLLRCWSSMAWMRGRTVEGTELERGSMPAIWRGRWRAWGRGIVYVLTNEAMPGYVKVGKTDSIERRLRDLDWTNLPLPFECFYAAKVADASFVESQLHEAFGGWRRVTERSRLWIKRLNAQRSVREYDSRGSFCCMQKIARWRASPRGPSDERSDDIVL